MICVQTEDPNNSEDIQNMMENLVAQKCTSIQGENLRNILETWKCFLEFISCTEKLPEDNEDDLTRTHVENFKEVFLQDRCK